MKAQLSSLDVCFLVKELSQLAGARIDKIYQIGERDLRIDLRAPDKKHLVVTPTYICLTKYEHEAPEKPSNFSMSLRKRLGGGIIKSIEQHHFDRIVEVTVDGRGKLILELFSKGNVIVVDEGGIITTLLDAQEWKDRTLKVGMAYKYPPETPDVMGMTMNDFLMRLAADKEIVKALASDLGLGATYANEVLIRAGVDPNSKSTKEASLKAYGSLKGMLDSKVHAQLVVGETAIDVVPFEMEIYKDEVKEDKESFNEAVDEYFTNLRAEGKKGEATKDYEKELQRVRIVITKQKETIAEMEKDIDKFKEMGDCIYAHFQEIDDVLKGIKKAKSEGKKWMEFLEEMKLKVTSPADREFEFEGAEIAVDKSVAENASINYEKSKRAKSKLAGALHALKKSEAELARIGREKMVAEKKLTGPVERHKPEWYEKFRWFMSSDGFLVIGGRDAASNEVLIKKHTEKNDVVFHSSVHGAPFFVIKNPEGKEIPESTRVQAAEGAASYSSAWTDELGSADVYAIRPEQVSKTPESGEYLSRGAFVIRGEREWFRGVPLNVAIGFKIGDYALAIGGPEGAVKSQTKYYANVGVGSMKSGELASAIKANILRRTGKDEGQKVKKVVLGELQKWIPAGKGMLLK